MSLKIPEFTVLSFLGVEFFFPSSITVGTRFYYFTWLGKIIKDDPSIYLCLMIYYHQESVESLKVESGLFTRSRLKNFDTLRNQISSRQ